MSNIIFLSISFLEQIGHIFHFILNIVLGIIVILALLFIPCIIGKFVSNDNCNDEVMEWFLGCAVILAICVFISVCLNYS